jgi:signal peptidase I
MTRTFSTLKITETPPDTEKDPSRFSFGRIFNRNGHEEKPAPETKPKGPPKSVLREYFESAVVTVIMALFGMTFIVQAVKVPTGSMQNTITIGDHLLVNKFIFAPGETMPLLPQREISRGDIIVFKYPGNKYDPDGDYNRPDNKPITTNYVKRVIGLPGDTIHLDGRSVIVNGTPLPEHQIEAIDYNQKDPLKITHDPPRKPGQTYNVYYRSDLTDDDYPLFEREVKVKDKERSRRTTTLSWVTIGITARTAATGVLFRATTSLAAQCLFTGPTTKAPLWVIIPSSTSSRTLAGAAPAQW